MDHDINLCLWGDAADGRTRCLFYLFGQQVRLLKGKGAGRGNYHISEELVANTTHAHPPHLKHVSKGTNLHLDLLVNGLGAQSSSASIVSFANCALTQMTMPETPRAATASACPSQLGREKRSVSQTTSSPAITTEELQISVLKWSASASSA
jgi:hypothetical protein